MAASRDYREHEACDFVAVEPVGTAFGHDWQVCTTHTYFGNGIEPNPSPCRFDTRYPATEESRTAANPDPEDVARAVRYLEQWLTVGAALVGSATADAIQMLMNHARPPEEAGRG